MKHEHKFAIGDSGPSAHPIFTNRGRRLVELKAFIVRSGGEIVDVRVLDLTYDGCKVQTETPLSQGEEINLSVLGRGAIKANVRWYKDRRAGLQFAIDPPAREHRPRQTDRTPLTANVSLRRFGRAKYSVNVFDVSPHGCRCEFVERPEIKDCVWVKFDGIEALEAEVRWIEGSCCGLNFEKAMHPAVFDLLLQRLAPEPN